MVEVGPVRVNVNVGCVITPTEFVYESCPVITVVAVLPGGAVIVKTPTDAKFVNTEVL